MREEPKRPLKFWFWTRRDLRALYAGLLVIVSATMLIFWLNNRFLKSDTVATVAGIGGMGLWLAWGFRIAARRYAVGQPVTPHPRRRGKHFR